jgi:hypothetical protein
MSYAWYPLWAIAAAAWVFIDARRRMGARWWPIAVLAGGPAGLAAYFALRPLREGESREGGLAWQVVSMFVVCWTALLAVAGLWNLAIAFITWSALGIAWLVGALPALVIGLALKRSTVEHGPTGMLRAMAGWYSGPEKSADGRAYICRECGKEYPVTLRFCDGCGAWPGQSG